MNAPQAVTERYVMNLIHYGSNREFNVITIRQYPSLVSGEHIGNYFETVVRAGALGEIQVGRGATIQQAVHRALEKHGVTFR